jgi:hypothetical protein
MSCGFFLSNKGNLYTVLSILKRLGQLVTHNKWKIINIKLGKFSGWCSYLCCASGRPRLLARVEGWGLLLGAELGADGEVQLTNPHDANFGTQGQIMLRSLCRENKATTQ